MGRLGKVPVLAGKCKQTCWPLPRWAPVGVGTALGGQPLCPWPQEYSPFLALTLEAHG